MRDEPHCNRIDPKTANRVSCSPCALTIICARASRLPHPSMIAAIADERLRRQRLTAAGLRTPEDVVAWFGAVQAQEYEPAKWALALRMREGVVAADLERAFDEGRILRTHVMRPTWHFVTASDIRWLLELTAPGVHRRMAPYNRQLELDTRTLTRALRVIERALRDQRFFTRAELGEQLQRAALPATSVRLAHVAMHAELERVVCSGPRRGKQFTYALLAERAPKALRLSRDEALATLGTRFFTSHGPATSRDFAWWSGLAAADAKRSIDIIKARRLEVSGRTYWTIPDRRRAGSPAHRSYTCCRFTTYPCRIPRSGCGAPWTHRDHAGIPALCDVRELRRHRRTSGGHVAPGPRIARSSRHGQRAPDTDAARARCAVGSTRALQDVHRNAGLFLRRVDGRNCARAEWRYAAAMPLVHLTPEVSPDRRARPRPSPRSCPFRPRSRAARAAARELSGRPARRSATLISFAKHPAFDLVAVADVDLAPDRAAPAARSRRSASIRTGASC